MPNPPIHSNDFSPRDMEALKSKLNAVSPSFCLAKWYQVTLNLHAGTNASCCLQPPMVLDPEEVARKPSRIHNGEGHIEQRYQLLKGREVGPCRICREEERDGDFSERFFKSGDFWALPKNLEAPGHFTDVRPTYVEVGFSRQCQMRCSYCNGETSSAIAREIEEHGPYPTAYLSPTSTPPDPSLFKRAFWQWLPHVYEGLKVLRLTGGEPFLCEDTFTLLDYIKKNPNPEMNLEFNTNLSFSSGPLDRFTRALKAVPRGHYGEVRFFVSLDCLGKEAEYIRYGMKVSVVKANIKKLSTTFSHAGITITATVGALSVGTFWDLLQWVDKWKREEGPRKVQLSSFPLISPAFQSVELLDSRGIAALKSAESFACASPRFSFREAHMIGRIRKRCERAQELPQEVQSRHREEFYRFFSEYDRRKKTDFLKTFPSLRKIYREGQRFSEARERQWREEMGSDSPTSPTGPFGPYCGPIPDRSETRRPLCCPPFGERA